jgi:hypothetical protein
MMHLLLSVLVFLVLVPRAEPALGIPGTTQTESGYDTELGKDPICWRSNARTVEGEIEHTPFPNPLVNDFNIQGKVTLLRKCPTLNFMTAKAPIEFQRGERLRTGEHYDYKVSITLNLDSLGGNAFISDKGPVIAIQLIVCKLGAGFCSPFIHEESNARLAAQGIYELPEKGDSHGGTHTHSGYHFFKVPPEDGPIYKLNVTIPMLVNTAAEYFAIASVQMYVGEELGGPAAIRYDMANALLHGQRLITYQEPASIKVVPDGILIGSYVAIGLVSLVILFLLVETIKHRNHQVLQLTQGYFLIVMLVAALVMVVSSFLFEPQNDFYCNASFPIILTSGQLLHAITLGRLWRINAVISPLLITTFRQKKSVIRRMMESLMSAVGSKIKPRKQTPKNLRKKISSWQLALVAALLTLPQAFLQILAIVLQPESVSIELNEDESQGRVMCDPGFDMKSSLRDYGLWMFLLLVFSLLFMAHATSQLPSLFNESKVIYESTLFSVVLLVLGFGVIAVTDDPTASPAVSYLVSVFSTLSVAANTSLRIMLPKLRMVWRNEKVVVSKLVSDHAKHVREEDARYANSGDELADEIYAAPATAVGKDSYRKSSSTEFTTPSVPEMSPPGSSGMPLNAESFKRRLHALPSQRWPLSNKIMVQCDKTPARRLVLKMVHLQEKLMAVNNHIISGVQVSEEEWMSVRDLIGTLGSTFHDDVDFVWENKNDGPNTGIGEFETELIIEEEEEEEEEPSLNQLDYGGSRTI